MCNRPVVSPGIPCRRYLPRGLRVPRPIRAGFQAVVPARAKGNVPTYTGPEGATADHTKSKHPSIGHPRYCNSSGLGFLTRECLYSTCDPPIGSGNRCNRKITAGVQKVKSTGCSARAVKNTSIVGLQVSAGICRTRKTAGPDIRAGGLRARNNAGNGACNR